MHREKLIQLIHVAKSHTQECCSCGHLKTDSDTTCMCGSTDTTPISETRYRASLEFLTGKQSCKDMSEADLEKVYAMFKKIGFKPVQTSFSPSRSESGIKDRVIRSIEERSPAILGVNWEARIKGFVRKMGVDSLEFCDMKQLRKVQGWLSRAKNTR